LFPEDSAAVVTTQCIEIALEFKYDSWCVNLIHKPISEERKDNSLLLNVF